MSADNQTPISSATTIELALPAIQQETETIFVPKTIDAQPEGLQHIQTNDPLPTLPPPPGTPTRSRPTRVHSLLSIPLGGDSEGTAHAAASPLAKENAVIDSIVTEQPAYVTTPATPNTVLPVLEHSDSMTRVLRRSMVSISASDIAAEVARTRSPLATEEQFLVTKAEPSESVSVTAEIRRVLETEET